MYYLLRTWRAEEKPDRKPKDEPEDEPGDEPFDNREVSAISIHHIEAYTHPNILLSGCRRSEKLPEPRLTVAPQAIRSDDADRQDRNGRATKSICAAGESSSSGPLVRNSATGLCDPGPTHETDDAAYLLHESAYVTQRRLEIVEQPYDCRAATESDHFHHRNLRVTSVGMNLLSYSWGEVITLRALTSIAQYWLVADKLQFPCLPTEVSTQIRMISFGRRTEGCQQLRCSPSLSGRGRQYSAKAALEIVQPVEMIKSICARLQAGVTAVTNYFREGDDTASRPSRTMSEILIDNERCRHEIPTADSSEAQGLNKIVSEMAERLYPGKHVRKGKDGLFAIFCDADSSQWCLEQAERVCKERLYGSIFTCNKGQLRDENWSCKTHFLLGA